jgi:hypothetical protein
MALRSRRQRDLEQKRRMARGKRNLSQLAGPVAQGQRTPMNRGSGSVSSVQAPPFQQSDPGADLTTAAMAYKGGKGLFDFTQGKEAYIDEAGNAIKKRDPWTIGGETIPEKIDSYGTGLGNLGKNVMNMEPGYAIGKDGTLSSSMFGAPWEPISMGGSGGGMLQTPQSMAQMSANKGGFVLPQAAQAQAGSPAYFQQLQNLNPMSNAVSASTVGSNLPSGGGAFAGSSNIGASGANQLATKAPSTAGSGTNALGAAGAGIGAGLNIYDMTQQGITGGNALGLGGSALLGANALGIGLANSWNPLGWGMLAASAAGSLFDWW